MQQLLERWHDKVYLFGLETRLCLSLHCALAVEGIGCVIDLQPPTLDDSRNRSTVELELPVESKCPRICYLISA